VTRALLVLLAAAGCGKDKSAKHDARPFEHPPIADAMPDAPVDWSACDAAIKQAAAAPPYDRPKILIDGCAVCGDWKPLFDWAVLPKDGGPTIAAIDRALHQCDAICDAGVGKRVASALDNARGTDSRAPWRIIGAGCKDKVSAVPDARYMSTAYFALDRIGRTVGGRGGEAGKLLETIEFPLPPATMSGVGPTLPPGPPAPAGRVAISLLGPELRLGKLPIAKLGAHGVSIDADYPGTLVAKLDELAGAIAKAAPSGPVVVLAPKAIPATRIAELSRAAKAPLALGIAAPSPPTDWQLPAVLPVAIDAKAGKRLDVTATMTVEDLATQLAPLAGNGVTSVALVVK
jgi:hypothetical protein